MKVGDRFRLLGYVLAAEAVGLLSGPGKAGAVCKTLAMPPASPPGWVFGIVWPVLYALMGKAAWLVSRAGKKASGALFWYWIQLG